MNISIIVSEFNHDITQQMLEEAKNYAKTIDIDIGYVCYVPGVFDMPLMLENLLKKKEVDAIVTLGAVIKGETAHDFIIAENTARLIADLSLKYGKPISLGITGPDMTLEQAWNRAKIVPIRAIEAVINMFNRIQYLNNVCLTSNSGESIVIK